MKLNTRNIVWGILGILFALGSLWIHYQIKVEMPRDDFSVSSQFRAGNGMPVFYVFQLIEERPVIGSATS